MVDDLKRNITLVIIAAIVYIIIFVVIIVKVWSPNKNNTIIKYKTIDFESNVTSTYIGELKGLLMSKNIDELYSKLDLNYIKDNNFNKETFTQYANSKRLFNDNAVFYEYEVANDGDTYIYIFKYRSNGFERTVNIIETKPYEYTISFEQNSIPGIGKINLDTVKNNIRFEIKTLLTSSENIKYQAKITNQGSVDATFDFLSINGVSLIKNDGSIISLAAVVASSDNEGIIHPNSNITKELFFNINYQEFKNIKGIVFENVNISDTQTDIEVDF